MGAATAAYKPTAKQLLWFRYYTDETNKELFLNGVQCALKVYDTESYDTANQIAVDNKRNLTPLIVKWLDDGDLSEAALKLKLKSLMSAKETKFFAKDGEVIEEKEVEALGVQRLTLDMALKVRGMYAADQLHITGLDGLAGRLDRAGKRANPPEDDSDDLFS